MFENALCIFSVKLSQIWCFVLRKMVLSARTPTGVISVKYSCERQNTFFSNQLDQIFEKFCHLEMLLRQFQTQFHF